MIADPSTAATSENRSNCYVRGHERKKKTSRSTEKRFRQTVTADEPIGGKQWNTAKTHDGVTRCANQKCQQDCDYEDRK